jgi:competence protein ComEC
MLERRRIPIETLVRGDRIAVGGTIVEVLHPRATDGPSDNNNSLVFRIVYGSRAILFTGDIERPAEIALLMNGHTLASDVVKVAHHGSRTSSIAEFIGASHPQYAIMSVGRRSPFGHPHPDVVARWQAAGATVLTTGEKGMISISTDGRDLDIKRFIP